MAAGENVAKKQKLKRLHDKIDSIRERVEANDSGIESDLAEYAMMKVEMDKMFAEFKRAELGTTMADCDMPYD